MPRAFLMRQPTSEDRGLGAFAPALLLLVIACVINYIDRGNVSVGAPLIRKEFGLSDSQLGILFSTFFVAYTAGQFLIGWLVDRADANRILAAGFLLWTLATATTGVVGGFVMLLAMRLVLGFGESAALPAASKILAGHLAEHHRGFASGALMSALRCGNAVGTLGAGLLMARFGWRPVFIWVGLVGLLWLPAWMRWKPQNSYTPARAGTGGPSFSDILCRVSFWGTCAGHFCSNYLFYFMATWLPTYLVNARHLSMSQMARTAGLYYSVDALSAISTGWLQDLVIRSGRSVTVVRKGAMAIGFSTAAFGVAGCALAGSDSYLWWLLAAGWGCGMTGPGLFTFPQTLAGRHAVGKWYGWQNGFANFAGIICPSLTGFVLQSTGSFLAPFAITACICVIGVVSWVFIVGRVEPVQWGVPREAVVATANSDA
jgi:ACS family D-galactonate transporter-like MFS transporter